MAAGWWLNGARNLAAQSDALPLHFWIRNRNRRQQRFGIGMERRGIKLAGGRGLDDATEIHHGNALADMLDDRQIMGNKEISETDALALAAGELVRIASHMIRLQTDGLEQIHDTLFKLPPGFRQLVNDQGFANDRADVHPRIERCIRVL